MLQSMLWRGHGPLGGLHAWCGTMGEDVTMGGLADTWWMILLSVASGVTGQTLLKLGVDRPGSDAIEEGMLGLIRTIVTTPLVLAGLFFYGLGALAWISVLRRMDLGLAYPFLALNFVLITLVARYFLGESVPLLRWAGILVIVVGILLVARSSGQ